MFAEVEGIIKRQINVSMNLIFLYRIPFSVLAGREGNKRINTQYSQCLLSSFYMTNFVPGYSLFQISVLPSVQPFHAIAYPIDPLLALEIRYSNFPLVYALQNDATLTTSLLLQPQLCITLLENCISIFTSQFQPPFTSSY